MNYRAYHKQIVGNVIAYIAKRYKEELGYEIHQMVMYKILALFDFTCVRMFGEPCTELDFRAKKMGPVPSELYKNPETENTFSEFKTVITKDNNGQEKKKYECACEPDLDYISEGEKKVLDKIINRFISEKISAKRASDISHQEIKAWKKAFDRSPDSQMLYAEEFDRNIFSTDENELTPQEYTFKLYNEFANV